MKKWVILIALLGAGFGGYSVWNNWQKSKPAANALNEARIPFVKLLRALPWGMGRSAHLLKR